MLECKVYSIAELSKIIKTTGKQATNRKLTRWDIKYKSSGRGNQCLYEITGITNPLKVFFFLELHAEPQSDWRVLRDVFYYFYCIDAFEDLSFTQMEDYLEERQIHISRQTISKCIRLLDDAGYILRDKRDCSYYIIRKENDKKRYDPIERKKYSEYWAIFWEVLAETQDRNSAFLTMAAKSGGVPYKHPNVNHNAIYVPQVNQMLNLITESYLNETETLLPPEFLSQTFTK